MHLDTSHVGVATGLGMDRHLSGSHGHCEAPRRRVRNGLGVFLHDGAWCRSVDVPVLGGAERKGDGLSHKCYPLKICYQRRAQIRGAGANQLCPSKTEVGLEGDFLCLSTQFCTTQKSPQMGYRRSSKHWPSVAGKLQRRELMTRFSG